MQYGRDQFHFDGVKNKMDVLEVFIGRFKKILPSETQDRVFFLLFTLIFPLKLS